MDGLLEQQRRYHEERERLVDTMVREWLHDKKTHKERINSDHRLKTMLDRYLDSTGKLADAYMDVDGQRKDEVEAIGGPNEFAEFYNRLKALKDTHRKNPDEIAVPLSMEFQEMNEMIDDPHRVEMDMVPFTDEEGYGRYLDLHLLFERYVNLKGVQKVDYINYLSIVDKMFDIPKETRKTGEYRRYVEALFDYMQQFVTRTRPLLNLNEELQLALTSFAQQWADGTFLGWPKESSGALTHTGAHLDLSPFDSAGGLQSLGLDRLKSALMALGLKCGGTLKERSERLFATKGKRVDELEATLFAADGKKRATAAPVAAAADRVAREQERARDLASVEARVYHMFGLLADERAATRENVERKQARTVGEEDEDEDEVVAPPSDEERDDDAPYNPKNLPLGWDGKPIPYWLYKLHGLNISYPCEICGNQVYKGPKAFQRHFSEWRHSHGMRCLGIPNTAHFANITKITDAIELWQRIREQKEHERFQPELEEEFEDSQGNVVTKRTYEDLKRQGLL